MWSRQARNRSGPRKGQGWGLLFGLPLPGFVVRSWAKRGAPCHAVLSSRPNPGFASLSTTLQINEGSGTPANAGSATAASCDAARALLERARLTAFHHGSHLGEYFIPKVSFRPGFLGRGLNGRYPPSPVPVQGCTSHPGRNAGRHDAQAAREQAANPPAGTALAPMTRCASASCPSRSEDCDVTVIGTNVKRTSLKKIRRKL